MDIRILLHNVRRVGMYETIEDMMSDTSVYDMRQSRWAAQEDMLTDVPYEYILLIEEYV